MGTNAAHRVGQALGAVIVACALAIVVAGTVSFVAWVWP